MYRKAVGALGERTAAGLLGREGYRIVEKNFRCREGEIDIIAEKGGCLVFVEVRTRRGNEYGAPEESLTEAKKERMGVLADLYLQTLDVQPESWRIDLVAVELSFRNKIVRVEHIENVLA